MATYYSNQIEAAGRNVSRPINAPGHGLNSNLKALYFELTTTAAATSSDTFYLGWAPKGFRYLGASIAATDMDSGTTLSWHLGDSGDTDRLLASQTVGQTNTFSHTARAPAADLGFGYKYTADTLLQITVAANADAAGTFYIAVYGIMDAFAS